MRLATILIVEDERAIARDLQWRLQNMGYNVPFILSRGEDVVRVTEDVIPDLILMDIKLSGQIDGIETAGQILAKSDVPIIYLTSYADEEILERAKITDPFGYLIKPVTDIELRGTVETTLYKHQTEKKLRESEKKYRSITESITDYIYSVNIKDGSPAGTAHGEACFAVTGYTSREFADDPCLWIKIVPEEDCVLVNDKIKQVFSGRFSDPVQHRITRKDGVMRWVESSFIPHHDVRGNVVSCDGIVRDITERKQIEKKLQDTNQFLNNILDNTHMLVAYLDRDFNFIQVNRAYADADGKEPSFFPGRNHFDLYPDKENEDVFRSVVETGEPYFTYAKPFEYFDHPDRGVSYWDWSLIPVKNAEGTAVNLVLTLLNVTDRIKLEREADEKAYLNQVLLDHMPCIAMILKKGTREIIACNETAKKMGAEIGKTCFGSIAGLDRNCPFCLAPEVWDTGEKKVIEADYLGISWKGHWVPLTEDLYLHYIFDMTEEKEAERKIRESEEKYRNLVETSQDLIWECDAEGRFTYLNKTWEAVIGYTVEEMMGRMFTEFQRPEIAARDVKEFKRHLAGGSVRGYATSHVSKSGRDVDLIFNAIPLYNSDGHIIGTQGTAFDITERRNLEKAILETEERERQLIGSDLHDGLGQLLAGISLKMQHLVSNLRDAESQEADNAERIKYLIEKAKEQTKLLARGLMPVDKDLEGISTALEALAFRTSEMFSVPCTFRNADHIAFHNNKAVPHLYRIAQEAVTNAVKHAHPGHIEVCLSKNDDKVTLTVKDDGKGIPAQSCAKGIGMQTMHYRAGLIGASLDIVSDAGGGTLVTCILSDREKEGDQAL